ncbi:DUF4012 domain-containing protein [Nocardioides sp. W7]|uniref:DUF4012 domain-containing protein n=1 Tax=Nocardioides sp. W7 TaxID=2931390 RepID=UPI001FD46337|nr:DUF4012 domain-containing protein [Nocardioides sp. W7]
MRRMPSWRITLFTVLGLALVAGAWLGWQVWQVNKDLIAAVNEVDVLRSAADAGDVEAMDRSLDRLEQRSASAEERTSGVTWAALTRVPWFGDDARGVRVVSSVVHDLAAEGARPLVGVSQSLKEILPRGGQVSIDALVELQAPVGEAERSLAEAEDALAEEDPADFVMRLRDKYRDLAGTVRSTHRAMASASTALQVMPTMLGGDEQRNYLLVFQNNAEIRATGGLPGAVALIQAADGRIKLARQVGANTLSSPGHPYLPLSETEEVLYGDLLGTYFVNANMTPDFPRAASLMKAGWEREAPERIDGVLAIDPVALSYLLAVTGPVQVGDTSITAENVVDELLHGVYLRYEDPADQDAFFQDVAQAAFDQVLGGADDAQGVLRALSRGAVESRIYVHSFEEAEQQALGGSEVAGELVTEQSERPQVTVALNDSTGAKMSYFLRYDVRVEATSCGDRTQSYVGSARLESTAPADAATLPDYITGGGLLGADPGTQFVNVQIFAPPNGSVTDLRVNSTRIESAVVDQDGRPVDTVAIQLEPGQKVRLSWRMTSGPDQVGTTDVSVTPGIEPRSYSSQARSAC